MTSSPNPHRTRALEHLEASLTARDALADLYSRNIEIPRARVAELHEQVRLGVKLAQVHALLSVEHRLAALTPADLDRIVAGGLS